MDTRKRHEHIDTVKAIATIVVMITHVLAYHLGNASTWFLWNYSHFVVVGLVFSSAYLFAQSHPIGSYRVSFGHIKKRFLRLYVPYLMYICIHATLMNMFPNLLLGYGWKKTWDFFVSNITLTGGVDFGWLTVLFIQIAILSPILLFITRHRTLRAVYAVSMALFIITTTFLRIPMSYSRLVAWLPWSSIAFLAFLYSDYEKKSPRGTQKVLQVSTLASGAIWVLFHVILNAFALPHAFSNHKYPPDISYLSYGVSFTGVILLILARFPYRPSWISRLVTYVSKQSYQLFFIHFIYLDLVMTRLRSNWVTECVTVITLTFGTSLLIRLGTQRLFKSQHANR